MNFLAHLALSGKSEGIIMGNFSGDFIKGTLTTDRTLGWPEDYLIGVKLHRYIDSFTDTHPVVREAKKVLSVPHPKVAGVILDIFYDYFLANHFTEFHGEAWNSTWPKPTIYCKRKIYIPKPMWPMAEAMIRHDWLGNYKEIKGIKRSFRRYRQPIPFYGGHPRGGK